MSYLIAYGDADELDFNGFPWICDGFGDSLEEGLARKKFLLKNGFKDVILFDISLDEPLGDYFRDGPVSWEFVRSHEVVS